VGVIVVAIVGNAAENSTAIMMALRNKVDLSIAIAVGSSLQIALFVARFLCSSAACWATRWTWSSSRWSHRGDALSVRREPDGPGR